MQWSHIKTLFILSFLLLNIYLIIQFVDKQNASDISVLDSAESSLEEQLTSENITLEGVDLETDLTGAAYTEVNQKNLTDEELRELSNFEGQTPAVINNNFIVSQFEEPVELPQTTTYETMDGLLDNYILYPDQYEFWGWNTDMNVLIFFQKRNDWPIYFNQNGLVLAYLNDSNEITHYTQTILGEGEAQGGEKTLIQPLQAIGSLYNRGDLRPNEAVTNVAMGYYSRIATEGTQVFAPTWKVTVVNEAEDEERNYFVNAIEGLVHESDNTLFLTQILGDNISKIQSLDDDSEIKEDILNQMENKLELGNRSEGE